MTYKEEEKTHRVAYTSFVFGGNFFNNYFSFKKKNLLISCVWKLVAS